MRKVSKAFSQGLFQAFELVPPGRKRSGSGGVIKRHGFEKDRLNLASDWETVLSDAQVAVKQYESGELNKASG